MEINPDVPTWDDLMDEVVWASLAAESIEPMDVAPESLSAKEAVDYLAALQRVRALVDALCGSGTPTPDVTTEIQVVIDAAALVGLTDCPATVASGPLTGSPLSAQAVRDMVTDPDVPTALRRLVTDPLTGHLLDRGRRSYQVSDAMRAFLTLRDRTWRSWSPVEPSRSGPGSGRRECVNGEHRGDRLPEPDRRQWHRQLMASHHSRIRESRVDGSCVWRSPLGHIYDVGPLPV